MTDLAADVLASLSTADQVETRIGSLEFTDGAPAAKTVEALYDHLDFVHALNAYLTAFPADDGTGSAWLLPSSNTDRENPLSVLVLPHGTGRD